MTRKSLQMLSLAAFFPYLGTESESLRLGAPPKNSEIGETI